MYKEYTALFLIVLVAAAQANTVNLLQNLPIAKNLVEGHHWEGLGVSANVNDYVDETIAMIVPFIQANGLDPMPLPDAEQGFEVKPLLVTYSAWLRIHDGYMNGLVNAARSGDQRVSYFAKLLRVRIQLQFTSLEFIYRYLVKVMNIGPTGGIIGSLSRLDIIVDLILDFNNDEIHLQEFYLTDIGRLRVRFTGNILTDWLVNPVTAAFTLIFDSIIIRAVANNINSAIQDAIGVINQNVKEVVQRIEAYNH